jgi:uncharacterized membrane protein YagU involved in acid resistance
MKKTVTPLRALLLGTAAGLAGGIAESLTRAAIRKIAPSEVKHVHAPHDIVVDRFVNRMMVERPMSGAQKEAAKTLLHILVFARWGGIYGLARETFPALEGPMGGALVGAAAWLVGGNLLLPAWNLTPRPTEIPLRTQVEALAEHVLSGAVTGIAYEALRR